MNVRDASRRGRAPAERTAPRETDPARLGHDALRRLHRAAALGLEAGRGRLLRAQAARERAATPEVQAEITAARAQVRAANLSLTALGRALAARGLAPMAAAAPKANDAGGAPGRTARGAAAASGSAAAAPAPSPARAGGRRGRAPRLPTIPEE